MTEIKSLDLAALDTPLQPVRFLTGGPEYAFHHIDGAGEQQLVSVRGAPLEEQRRAYEEVLARCIPEAPRDQIAALRFWKLDMLITLAGDGVRTVEEYLGKFRGATDDPSSSETPSATPSPA